MNRGKVETVGSEEEEGEYSDFEEEEGESIYEDEEEEEEGEFYSEGEEEEEGEYEYYTESEEDVAEKVVVDANTENTVKEEEEVIQREPEEIDDQENQIVSEKSKEEKSKEVPKESVEEKEKRIEVEEKSGELEHVEPVIIIEEETESSKSIPDEVKEPKEPKKRLDGLQESSDIFDEVQMSKNYLEFNLDKLQDLTHKEVVNYAKDVLLAPDLPFVQKPLKTRNKSKISRKSEKDKRVEEYVEEADEEEEESKNRIFRDRFKMDEKVNEMRYISKRDLIEEAISSKKLNPKAVKIIPSAGEMVEDYDSFIQQKVRSTRSIPRTNTSSSTQRRRNQRTMNHHSNSLSSTLLGNRRNNTITGINVPY